MVSKHTANTARRLTMTTKTKIAFAALLMLGIASAAQAGSKDDADATGGYAVGPMGQNLQGGAFGYVPRSGSTIRNEGRCWETTANGNYAWATCPQ
jgi:uncharacterized membrane protein